MWPKRQEGVSYEAFDDTEVKQAHIEAPGQKPLQNWKYAEWLQKLFSPYSTNKYIASAGTVILKLLLSAFVFTLLVVG